MTATHTHLCPRCWRYVPCDEDCTIDHLDGPMPAQQPAVCDDCERDEPERMLGLGFDPVSLGM